MKNKVTVHIDSTCVLCNTLFKFLVRLDWLNRLEFDTVQNISSQTKTPESILVYHNFKTYTKSKAVVIIMSQTPLLWPFYLIQFLIPRIGQDKCYEIIAQNRYRLFGQQSKCSIYQNKYKHKLKS